MEFTGLRVNHFKDGLGTIIAFYPVHNLLKVKFDMGRTSFYDYPQDFYPGGVLSTSSPDIINYINSLPRFQFSKRALGDQATRDKDLSVFRENCLSVLTDLQIPFNSQSFSLTINSRLKTNLCRSVRTECLTDSQFAFHYEIQVSPRLLDDTVADATVYQTLLKEILHVVRCTVAFSNSEVARYMEIIDRECGYQLADKLFLSGLPEARKKAEDTFSLPVVPNLNQAPAVYAA